MKDLPYEIILNICKYIPVQNLRKFCRLNKFSEETLNDIIKSTIHWHVTYGLGISMKTFYEDCIYYINVFFAHGKSIDSIEKYSKFPFEKKIYLDFLKNEKVDCLMLDILYLFFITKLSEGYVWNAKIIKKLLIHSVEDNIFLFSPFWIYYVSDTNTQHAPIKDDKLEIFKIVLKDKFYINYSILVNLFNNTYFPIQLFKVKLIDPSIFPSEKFLVSQRVNGNPYQIHNYNLIKEIFRLNIKYLYLKLLRKERSYIKKIIRIGNPYGKGKTMKLGSQLFKTVLHRLVREGFNGTFLDLQLERKLMIDEYQKLFF